MHAWSSSIAVKLSASAIHTFASLSVYVCVCFPYLLSCWKKKNQPGHECTHKSHVGPGSLSYKRSTGHFSLCPSSTLRSLEALVSNIQRVPQWPLGIAIPLEWCLSRHGGVLISIQCLITWCGAGQGGRGQCSSSPSTQRIRKNCLKVKTWCLGARLLGSVQR